MSALPDFVEEGLKKICRISKVPMEKVRGDYLEIFNDAFIQNDEQFTTDEERHTYSIAVLHSRFIARPRPHATPDRFGGSTNDS